MQILYDYQQKLTLNILILSILFVLFVACKLFRAVTASCYAENLHPGTSIIEIYPVSQSKSYS